jgi:hypothetical protein
MIAMGTATLRKFTLFLFATFLIVKGCGADMAAQNVSSSSKAERTLPIEFEPNRGQLSGNGLYSARAENVFLSLGKNELDVALMVGRHRDEVIGFRFEDANPNADLVGSEPTGGESNYLIGRASAWHTHIPHFARVTYNQLYPGIDLAFYGAGPYVEHDFIVAPGADPGRIRMLILARDGQPTVNAEGDLRIAAGDGEVVMRKPLVYQRDGTKKYDIEGRFRLYAAKEIGFEIGSYDRSRPLVIDPALSVSTYLANMSLNVSAVATDSEGNSYVSGLAFSPMYPVTSGSFQTTCASCGADLPSVFVTKLNPTGSAQVYSTFLGGSNYNQSSGLVVDYAGNTIVAGYTQSTDFPIKDSIHYGYAGVGTAFGFISSLTPDGSALNYSSLLGGSSQQYESSETYVEAVTVDQEGDAYIAGTTDSNVFPVTALDCCTPAYPNSIVFVTKFLPNGKLGYSSLVGNPSPQNGGGGPIGVSALQVDGTGSAYVSGQAGTLWPTTLGAYQRQIGGAAPYAAPFVTKLKPDGSALVYSTYLGNGSVNGIALDSAENVWVTGTPSGPNFPVTKNAYQPNPPASNCCVPFFSKLNAKGSKLLYSSFFYGNANAFGYSQPNGIALDAVGNVWLAGLTNDPQWPLIHPIQGLPGTLSSTSTGFVSRFNSTGTKLTFSTFFGGPSAGAQVDGLALDGKGEVHIAGFANDDLYTTPNAFLPTVTPPPPDNDYTYGFAAVIDPNTRNSAVCIVYPYNQGLFFGDVPLNTAAALTLTIGNCGTATLAISDIESSIPQFTIPKNLNGCKKDIAVKASCTLTVEFTPTQTLSYAGTLTIVSNASIPAAFFGVSGVGAVPNIQPSAQR